MNQKQKVLIVDDEPRNQKIVVTALDGEYEYKTAVTGVEALQLLESYRPDLVLLDIMMPGLDGYEVCLRIRSNPELRLVKVILVSGKAMIEERLKGYEVGADDYMTKPFVPEELMAKASVFLRLALLERQLADVNRTLEEKIQERTRQLLEAEAKLVNSAKMAALGEMAGGIAHEINTPLSTIGMLGEQIAELLDEDPIDKVTCKEMTGTIAETVHRIAGIVRGLRVFSRDGSQDKMRPTPFKSILEDTLALCGEKIKGGGVEIRLGEISDDLLIECRAVQVSQVLLNLVSNACDAIAHLPQRWIRIAAERRGGFVEISVTDSGKGIPEKVRDKIFQPFFTTKDIGKGTGLGLSVSKGIAESHKGTLTVDTASSNTRLVLSLPSGKAVAAGEAA